MPESFDQAFKLSNDEDPLGTLKYILGVRVSQASAIEVVDRELNVERQHADHLYRVRWQEGQCIHLAEAYTRYNSKWQETMMDHAVLARLKYRTTIRAHLLLFQRKKTPRDVPARLVVDAGSLQQRLKVEVVRLWKQPAKGVISSGREALYPWTALMDATLSDQRLAARMLRDSGRKDLQMRMALLGALRYGSLEALFERVGDMLTKELLQDTPGWKQIEKEAKAAGMAAGWAEGWAKGKTAGTAEGRAEGKAEGKAEGVRDALRRILVRRFGPIPESAQARIRQGTLEELEQWVERALDAKSIESVLG